MHCQGRVGVKSALFRCLLNAPDFQIIHSIMTYSVNFRFRSIRHFEKFQFSTPLIRVDDLRAAIFARYKLTRENCRVNLLNARTSVLLSGNISPNADIVGVRLPVSVGRRRRWRPHHTTPHRQEEANHSRSFLRRQASTEDDKLEEICKWRPT